MKFYQRTFAEDFGGDSLKVYVGWLAVFMGCALGLRMAKVFFPAPGADYQFTMVILLLISGGQYARQVHKQIALEKWKFWGLAFLPAITVGFVMGLVKSLMGR